MNRKSDVEVVIFNEKITISGFESPEYLNKLVNYINKKSEEIKGGDGFNLLKNELKHILLEVNIADELFKVQQRLMDLSSTTDEQVDAVGSLKREIVEKRSELEAASKEIEQLRSLLVEEQKKNIKLETELNLEKKNRK